MAPKKPLILGSRVQGGPKFSASTVSRANGTASLRKKTYIYIYILLLVFFPAAHNKSLSPLPSVSQLFQLPSPLPPHRTQRTNMNQPKSLPSASSCKCFRRVRRVGGASCVSSISALLCRRSPGAGAGGHIWPRPMTKQWMTNWVPWV